MRHSLKFPVTVEARVRSKAILLVFVVEKMTVGQAFVQVLWRFSVSLIPPKDRTSCTVYYIDRAAAAGRRS